MYTVDLNKPIKVHFVGIGGISMSSLAKILLDDGFFVTGSDRKLSNITDELKAQGAVIFEDHKESNITEGVELVVRTAAVHEDNVEVAEAVRRNIPVITRAELLGQIMKKYERVCCVAGTHGKTTTTSMLSLFLVEANKKPTALVGGVVKEFGEQYLLGERDYMVAEACEYTDSYHSFFPTEAVITNVDCDHLDYFKSFDNVKKSFAKFAGLVPENGMVAVNERDKNKDIIIKDVKCQVKSFNLVSEGEEIKGDIVAVNLSNKGGLYSFDLLEKKENGYENLGRISLSVPGTHNVDNALAAIIVARHYGISFEVIKKVLASFGGTKRRFDFKGQLGDGMISIYDDYSHHPTEIKATLLAAREVSKGRVVVVFQPHTYSRLKKLLPEFVEALSLADIIVLADVYAAREKAEDFDVNSETINQELTRNGKNSYHFESFGEIVDFLLTESKKDDLLITMGAGDVVRVAEILLGNENS